MPTSIDPGPAENEFECANCGAYFHYELTRCPNCGIQIYEPEGNETGGITGSGPRRPGMADRLKDVLHGIFNKPYSAGEIFGDALDASILYNDLLQKTAGDRAAADRLIEFEKLRAPQATRRKWIENAIQNWERDNQSPPARF